MLSEGRTEHRGRVLRVLMYSGAAVRHSPQHTKLCVLQHSCGALPQIRTNSRHHALCRASETCRSGTHNAKQTIILQLSITQQHYTITFRTVAGGAGLGPSPAPHCSPHRAPGLPGDGGTPAASISALSCHSPCPCCACWSSQAVMEDSGGPGATSHTQARSRTSKDERLRMGTCGENTQRPV